MTMLRDLTIQNYRCFQDFRVDGLARINLIVGKNSVGKTSLLEAIYLLTLQGKPSIRSLLQKRGEITYSPEPFFHATGIFRQTHNQTDYEPIKISSNEESNLNIEISIRDDDGGELPEGEYLLPGKSILFSYSNESVVKLFLNEDMMFKEKWFRSLHRGNKGKTPYNGVTFLTTSYQDISRLVGIWNNISLTPQEDRVVQALQIICPEVERISFDATADQYGEKEPFIKIRLKSEERPRAIGSMGDGIKRLLILAILAVHSSNTILLIDEIDIGLHHSVHVKLWKLILGIAQELNIQIFATTHTWDCVAAFEEVLSEQEDSSLGKLFRLDARGDELRAIPYSDKNLAIAVQQSIEVR